MNFLIKNLGLFETMVFIISLFHLFSLFKFSTFTKKYPGCFLLSNLLIFISIPFLYGLGIRATGQSIQPYTDNVEIFSTLLFSAFGLACITSLIGFYRFTTAKRSKK